MQIVIDIDDEDYDDITLTGKNTINLGVLLDLREAVRNGIPLPKEATNGDVIKAITGEDFSRSIYNHDLMICEGEYYLAFNIDWWNAPYIEADRSEENG